MNNATKKKLKVVWLCYFTNNEVQDILRPRKRIGEIAPWISNMIPLFENDPEVELHIVSEHRWISGIKRFEKNGVYYHFYNRGIPFWGRHWPGFFRFDTFNDYYLLRKTVEKIIHRIKPDIIHLHGAENEFCNAIIQFQGKYPVLITIQGFISKSTAKSKIAELRKSKEIEIIKTFKHFGYRTQTMGNDIKTIKPDAILHWHRYPTKKIDPVDAEKKFDLVFFARISKDKGIEDLLQAIEIIKKEKADISLCVIGGGDYSQFKQLAKSFGIQDNVNWAGFLPTQQDVHKLASTARLSVLPTYHDIISGTILESMFLKLPVVAYDVGSIHEVNEKEEIISLVDKQDVEGLAKAIEYLLDNDEKREEKAEKGYKRAHEMFVHSDDEIRQSLLNAYHKVIEDFHIKDKKQ